MAIEDFTTYTMVDEDGDITVTAHKCAVDTERNDAISYVKKSYGADHFGDFEHLMKLTWTAGDNGGWLNCWALTDGANTEEEMQDNTDGIELGLYTTAGGLHHIYLYDYETAHGDVTAVLTLTYTCWNTIKRAGTTFTVKIYSDASRTTLEDTLTIVSNTEAYEYVFPVMGRGDIGSGIPKTTFDTENLDLQEAPCTVSTGDATDITQAAATLQGTIDTMGNETSVDVTFEYGETAAYGEETPGSTETETGDISEGIEDLTANTTYHFRIKAVGIYGTAYGDDVEFDTLAVVAIKVKGTPFGLKPARVVKVGRVGV